MRHLIVAEHGTFVGVKSERVVVKKDGETICEVPMRNLRSIKVAKTGVALSSDLVLACSTRGIHLFFTNFKGESVGFLSGCSQHAVANVRRRQFAEVDGRIGARLAKTVLFGKIRNQRAVLLYFGKYQKKLAAHADASIERAAFEMAKLATDLESVDTFNQDWRQVLMGTEGRAAAIYFATWERFGVPLLKRTGRGASDPINFALNYGYAILQSHIWTSVTNAGLEPYVGFLHTDRPGKPSLVLDLMEEYRPWVVDRVVIKLMSKIEPRFEATERRRLVEEIENVLSSQVTYGSKRVRLATVIQRRAYRLAGVFVNGNEGRFSPLLFKW